MKSQGEHLGWTGDDRGSIEGQEAVANVVNNAALLTVYIWTPVHVPVWVFSEWGSASIGGFAIQNILEVVCDPPSKENTKICMCIQNIHI